MSEKTDNCFYCFNTLNAPINQSVVKCPKCRKMNIFLCHVIPTNQGLNSLTCLKCAKVYLFFNCPSCGGSQAIEHEKMTNGMKHYCPCGATFTFISCCNPQCRTLLLIKGAKSHQMCEIQCRKCATKFHYKICPDCKIKAIYKESWDQSTTYMCTNPSCKQSNIPNPYEMDPNKLYENRLTHFQNNNNSSQSKMKEDELCKVCLNKDADMINTKCYHLAVCQGCSTSLKNQCPICRATGGQFHKVFKA